ncbi:MAG: D,D-heptose 1,7-bisphosphate phosphatase [Elusimicrobia bacterium HGW-Elusimicrobia-4]|nr:MAG: D,D-heptose 1,7-bisphosphate phosphatase [Elusimicrobia bacterium HGW-Elusimicrobia-4]
MENKAVFLDRDGTINRDMHYSADVSRLRVFKNAATAIKILNNAEYKVIIISNQSGIARRYFKEKDVEKLNKIIIDRLGKRKAKIDAVYFCPHHPEENCNCRKPKPRMILQAKKDFNIDIKNSYMVGDMQSDIDLAKNTGAKSIFVLTGIEKNVKGADYTAKDILDAAEWIVRQN